ncbi:unnamed protein product [Acanthoscelides obtectus]|uniref:Uncharacterized protein n=1 Tax=Acanthoscelides obtectus TaxID=200917 RepID=A0A9P0P292_ACAOB|nr:unnamed protein product [Acanthoscelides obtectus]CAK1631050.1 hypothetical protein AOBTE_LOCUS6727 [Acanthoscelides obtectus]
MVGNLPKDLSRTQLQTDKGYL